MSAAWLVFVFVTVRISLPVPDFTSEELPEMTPFRVVV